MPIDHEETSRPDDLVTASSDPPPNSVSTPPSIPTDALFPKGLREIRIDHEGTEYRLRITKRNKLILYR